VLRNLTPNSQSGGSSSHLKMVNQDSTLRLHVFNAIGRDNVEQHWFTCEAIWSMKRITNETTKIMQLETTFRDITLT
jgi:hypothetical protein